MLNFELHRWMMNNPFHTNGLSKKRVERTNEDLSFPVVSIANTKKTNEILKQIINAKNNAPDSFHNGLTTERTEQANDDSSFLVAAVERRKKADEASKQRDIVENEAPDEFFNGSSTEIKEQSSEDQSFLVAAVAAKKADEASKQRDIVENEAPDEFFNASSTQIEAQSSEGTSFEIISIISGDSSEERIDFLSSQTEQDSLSQSEENESLFTLALEEKTDIAEDDKIDQFEGISSVETQEILVDIQDELNRAETISDEKSDVRIPPSAEKEEKTTPSTEDEILRAREEKRARANAFTEEYLKSREMITKQSSKMRKKQLVWFSVGFVSLFTLTIVTVLFFFRGTIDTTIGQKLPIVISKNNDDNSSGSVINEAASNSANSYASDDGKFNVVIDASDDSNALNTFIASVLGQSWQGAGSIDSLNTSEDNIEKIAEQNIASSDSVDVGVIIVENAINKEKPIPKEAPSGITQASAETKKTASATRRTTVNPPRTSGGTATRTATRASSQSMGSSARSTRVTSQTAIDLTQNRIFSAIKDERYFEAIDLSKSNLEKNSKDRLSFFFLGVAYYASSDFSGATRAFYACLNLDSPGLPDFLVEEFDSAESLESLFINYPGVDLLIRSVELNPQDKSLYLNLLLSNLKSEKPMLASEIYNAVLNHAQKRGLNLTKLD